MQVSGLNDLQKAISRMKSDFPKESEKFLTRQALKVERLSKINSPVDTGNLKSSWGYENSGSFESIVYNKADYANHVEFGHRIGKSSRVMPGRYMLKKAVKQVESEFEEEFKVMARRLFK